ncbi:hypothetical protein WJX79_005424 [Trebouxia sp. C0005]
MHLTPLGRPVRSLVKTGGSGKQAASTTAPLTPNPMSSSCDIHTLLENYSRQITQTEGQIDAIRQSQQQLDQQHALDLQDLHSAKVEAQQADEASATLAAEVHQLQMEINAKQADCSRIKGELADAVQSRTAISHDITNKRRQFISECQELDRQLRLLMEPRHNQDNPMCIAQE